LVALSGPPDSPHVIDRRRIELADPGIPGSKQPYHAAEPMDFPEAEDFLKRCTRGTSRLAVLSLRAAIDDFRALGFETSDLGVTLGSGRPLPALKTILSSHALIHTAEGEFYRHEMMKAGKQCGLAVLGVKERELFDRAAFHFRMPLDELERCVSALGKPIGPPWSQDQKYAALAAWLALSGAI
jgi:hypothetical protein